MILDHDPRCSDLLFAFYDEKESTMSHPAAWYIKHDTSK